MAEDGVEVTEYDPRIPGMKDVGLITALKWPIGWIWFALIQGPSFVASPIVATLIFAFLKNRRNPGVMKRYRQFRMVLYSWLVDSVLLGTVLFLQEVFGSGQRSKYYPDPVTVVGLAKFCAFAVLVGAALSLVLAFFTWIGLLCSYKTGRNR
jgi:hypothetical protein